MPPRDSELRQIHRRIDGIVSAPDNNDAVWGSPMPVYSEPSFPRTVSRTPSSTTPNREQFTSPPIMANVRAVESQTSERVEEAFEDEDEDMDNEDENEDEDTPRYLLSPSIQIYQPEPLLTFSGSDTDHNPINTLLSKDGQDTRIKTILQSFLITGSIDHYIFDHLQTPNLKIWGNLTINPRAHDHKYCFFGITYVNQIQRWVVFYVDERQNSTQYWLGSSTYSRPDGWSGYPVGPITRDHVMSLYQYMKQYQGGLC